MHSLRQDAEDGQDELRRNSNSDASASHAPEQANGRGSVSSQARAVPVSGHACAIQQVCMCHTRQSIPCLMVRSQKRFTGALACPDRSPSVQSSRTGVNRVGRMEIGPEILGYGSSGTLVFEGTLDGRPIAVKRILCQVCKVFPTYPVFLAMCMPGHHSGGHWDT